MLSVVPATEIREARTVSTEIASIDLRLGETIRQVAEANGYDSTETINVLERHGLPTALQFVQPLIEVLKRGPDSPLRDLSIMEIGCLYVDNARRQILVIDELEQRLTAGEVIVIQTGIVKQLWAQYRARVQAAKHRDGITLNRTRDDYQREASELRTKLQYLEAVVEKIAKDMDMNVDEFMTSILEESTDAN